MSEKKSKKEKPVKEGAQVDHTEKNIPKACGLTLEQCENLDKRFNPARWVANPELIDRRTPLTMKAEEVVRLPHNEAVLVITQLMGEIMKLKVKEVANGGVYLISMDRVADELNAFFNGVKRQQEDLR